MTKYPLDRWSVHDTYREAQRRQDDGPSGATIVWLAGVVGTALVLAAVILVVRWVTGR
jgi:hypothetical protein